MADAATWWWVAAGLAVAAELATGTLYLLLIALGLAAGALATHAGLGGAAQVAVAAFVAAVATALLNWRRRRERETPVQADRDVNLDVGERVHVPAWNADGTARIQYRGTQWNARLRPGAAAAAGEHRIAAVDGNWLVLEPALP